MKIPLNVGEEGANANKLNQDRVLENDILGAKRGDWSAKNNLARSFMPLITSCAQKRGDDTAKVNVYIELGKKGLFAAAKKYKRANGPGSFQLLALDFIEANMDGQNKGGFFSRLFTRG